MTSTADCDPLVKGVDDVLITAELATRPSRAPDYETESRALGRLAQEMATNPRGVLQKCAELVMELCHADSAGISILEPGGAGGVLRWHAAAGGFAPNLHGTMPQEASPCGTVIERDCVLLFHEAERFFPALRGVEPRIYENLLAPWHVEGKAVGTLWAIRHTPEGRFDGEDARVLQSLARFAAAAFQMTLALDEAIAERSAIRASEQQLRESEEKYRTLFDAIDEGLAIQELFYDGRGEIIDVIFREVNASYERQSGLHDVVGRSLFEVLPRVEDYWLDLYRELARTGRPVRVQHYQQDVDGWFDVYFSLFGEGRRFVAHVFNNITERKRAEAALRESEERQAFLLRFTDAIRSEPDEQQIVERAVQMLAEELAVDRAYATKHYPAADLTNVIYEVRGSDLAPLPATLRFSDFPEAGRQTFEQTLVFEDTANDPGLTEADKVALASMRVGALLSRPLRRGGSPIFALGVVSVIPRRWTAAEIALVEDVAERTWEAAERARGEAALRESEERFRQFADASAAGLWIRAADTLAMEFISPAVATSYGAKADALLGDVTRWAAMIVPDDRDAALGCLEEARRGEVVVHEFRIQRPSDGAFRWIRNTDFPLRDNGQILRIGGIAEDVTEAKLAAEHTAVLLAELQHRVRNIMAMIRSVTRRTGERAASVPDYAELLMGRLLALARVQGLLTRAANVSVGIAGLVHDEVSVQAQHEGQYDLAGPDVALSPKAAEVLTLAVHELATNALKYGALSVADGKVTVRWSVVEKRNSPWLVFDWTEEGAPEPPQPTQDAPRRRGFGSELIEARIPYELRGRGKVTIEPGGARCHLEFPLKEGASILETGAPQRMTVYGGALDMTGGPDLTGRRVLVVEDDFYLATDAARALEGAGAEIVGPCASEEAARAELDEQRPDAVVVDINLGPGPSFKLAETLKDRGIPFVFTTGYDAEVIPAEFAGVERLEKPFQLRQIVGAVAKLTTVA
ncbi:PAS domain S-box protein [Methylobacterium sp. 17Sr1-1]|uniref:PAS domain S-box protein n=1 Tax=Methylobacterium sp. 17Sr1-1 TaxID=2202826 RepID=UPI000D6F1058|nr:PAS domain S-box protein [Methylobacterium sp. 17Sr1-1]AWN51489.1 histidine kinase [Methylobacterium sp. 17Sr1-1]